MAKVDDKISDIIGTDDKLILDFVKNIKAKAKQFTDFQDELLKMEVGLNVDRIRELYCLLCILENKREEPTSIISILKRELKLSSDSDLEIIQGFVSDVLKKCRTWGEFKNKMNTFESGLGEEALMSIFETHQSLQVKQSSINDNQSRVDVKKEQDEQESSCLTLPDKAVNWGSLSDINDLRIKVEKPPPRKTLDYSPQLNKVYPGKVKRIMPFGCFVEIEGVSGPRCDGLVHISEIVGDRKIKDPSEVVAQGQNVFVQVIKQLPNGKISLSMQSVDQISGEIIIDRSHSELAAADRGRSANKPADHTYKIKKRKLTSPERWEIRQLIASGAASIEDYPELTEENAQNKDTNSAGRDDTANNDNEEDDEERYVDVELNTEDKPHFLKKEPNISTRKIEMPALVKIPRGTLNRAATAGSETMKSHREEKTQKKRDIEQQIRKRKTMDDPTKDRHKVKQEIETLKKQLVLTEWEKKKISEHITFGKRTSLPLSEQRSTLPVYKMRQTLVDSVRDNQFLVIVGETGSGKTTQITQYLNEEGFSAKGIIGCTQPRRVAAISVSKRVAEEVGCRVGDDVGYTIRFEDKTSSRTKIKYMTDGMLQREALLDPLMKKYSVIMLDEAHERTVATDILFALLKQAAAKRPDLKVIVTSATLDSAKFSEYFLNCPIINIPGKTFPVEVFYAQSPQMDYIEATLDCVMDIHTNGDPGDILVFLTGQEEIDSCCEILYEKVKNLQDASGELIILPVYSALPSEIQSKIFEPTPEGSRKVVFATNIAETSITIDGISYVVDPGFSKINTYNPRAGMEQLVVSPISQAQANQRKGRAGRVGPGKCYRLYTESAFYNELLPNTVPEIQRQNLSHTILMLKAMGINDLLNFDFMDPPPKNLMLHALTELYNLEALDTDGILTKLGQRMSQFPMDPTLSRSLLSSVKNNCSDEIITIIAMLSVQNVFYRPRDKQQEADGKKARFHHPYGDHLTLLNVYTRWEQSSFSDQFCDLNFLHFRHLRRARDVKKQISNIFLQNRLPLVKCYGDPDVIRRTLVAGFFMNAAKRDSQVGYKTILGGTTVGVHPSSALSGKEHDYVIYHSLVLTSREYMSQVTCINAEWLIECAPHFYKSGAAESHSRKRAKIVPLHDKFSKNQNSWRLSSKRQSREKALGIKR